jgi:hypothetical protein
LLLLLPSLLLLLPSLLLLLLLLLQAGQALQPYSDVISAALTAMLSTPCCCCCPCCAAAPRAAATCAAAAATQAGQALQPYSDVISAALTAAIRNVSKAVLDSCGLNAAAAAAAHQQQQHGLPGAPVRPGALLASEVTQEGLAAAALVDVMLQVSAECSIWGLLGRKLIGEGKGVHCLPRRIQALKYSICLIPSSSPSLDALYLLPKCWSHAQG